MVHSLQRKFRSVGFQCRFAVVRFATSFVVGPVKQELIKFELFALGIVVLKYVLCGGFRKSRLNFKLKIHVLNLW